MSGAGRPVGGATARPSLLPTPTELVPWTDRRGRFHPLRALVLALACLPGLVLAGRWATGQLGADPVSFAIHSTGFWAVWVLLASLCVSPVKAIGNAPNVVVVRRLLGNAAMAYAAIHLLIYAADQKWKLWTIVSEIVKRFYLTIGFAALLGFLVLAFTSTDGWARFLGRNWKRLHRTVYALGVLALLHFVLQSKLDISLSLLACGVFAWLMLWRLVPAGSDRSLATVLGLAVGAAALTLAMEYLWYRFGTRVDPAKALGAELDLTYGLHPAAQVLLLGLAASLLLGLRRLHERGWDEKGAVSAAAYGLAGLAGLAAPWFFGWLPGLAVADEPFPFLRAGLWVVALAVLGRARAALEGNAPKTALDAVLLALVGFDVMRLVADDPRPLLVAAAVLLVAVLGCAGLMWRRSRWAGTLLVPAAFLAWAAALAARAPPPV